MKYIVDACGYLLSAAVALGTLCAAYGGKVDPDVSTIPAIFGMTLPFWLGGSVALIILWILLRKRLMALLPFLGILCSIGPVSSYSPVNLVKKNVSEQDADKVFTLLSFNVAGFFELNAPAPSPDADGNFPPNKIMEFIINSGADIVALQEGMRLVPVPHLGLTEQMIDTLHTIYPYVVSPDSLTYAEARSQVLSKFPMKQVKLSPNEGTAEWSASMIDVRGLPILLVDVHLQSLGLTHEDKQLYLELTEGEGGGKIQEVRHSLLSKISNAMRLRARQSREIRQIIDSIGAPNVIVAGDFNDIPGCYAIRQISGDDFRNAFNDAANGPMITFHSDRFYFHIDHILYRGQMKAIDFVRGKCDASDHYPIEATFLIE